MSRYMVLELDRQSTGHDGDKNTWREVGAREASSAETAVRAHVQAGGGGGVYLAIPERSAKTIRVKVETVQKVSVDAGEETTDG